MNKEIRQEEEIELEELIARDNQKCQTTNAEVKELIAELISLKAENEQLKARLDKVLKGVSVKGDM